mgnify:CR=1 FL=1
MNIFEQASRLGIRFTTSKGIVTVEDLWHLPLQSPTGRTSLDDIAKALHRELKECEETSFVTPSKVPDPALVLRFDIVKHIIDVRLAENAAAATARANTEKKQKLLEILARKQDASLESASEEEIRAMINAL